ncbi:MAG: HD domain-containing protein [Treponema sp.]|nr:HD domain-containing protein [Treponema sp.]MBQ7619686.1 HD domain-containing protein [Treponema sp.]MBQ9625947.1 HD domain-containing protein [Treponema sp.]
MKPLLDTSMRSKILAAFVASFAFVYHFSLMWIFYSLGVIQMFYFNIGSVLLFVIIDSLVLTYKPAFWMYTLCFFEVVVHQVLAEYFTGAATNFHYFILLMGLLPFIIFTNQPRASMFLGGISSAAFVVVEVMGPRFEPIYVLDPKTLFAITTVNVSLFVIVVLALITLFTLFILFVETAHISEINEQAQKIQIQNARVIEMQNNTIIGMANLVENRDVDTGEHVKRTSAYVKLLAEEAKKTLEYRNILTDKYIALVVKAAPMHDIGKIVVPDAILKKPGKLTLDEFLQIQRHTIEGARIVHEVLDDNSDPEYVKIAAEIALCHHEKWNGSGYPQQLEGLDIPVCARIMALADVFDALVSMRCYKEPFSCDEAFQIIQDASGKHFDPVLVDCFMKIRPKIEKYLKTSEL